MRAARQRDLRQGLQVHLSKLQQNGGFKASHFSESPEVYPDRRKISARTGGTHGLGPQEYPQANDQHQGGQFGNGWGSGPGSRVGGEGISTRSHEEREA